MEWSNLVGAWIAIVLPVDDKGARGDACAHCHKPAAKTAKERLLCGKCLQAAYCSQECQKAHWKAGHKVECQPPAPATAPPDDDDDDATVGNEDPDFPWSDGALALVRLLQARMHAVYPFGRGRPSTCVLRSRCESHALMSASQSTLLAAFAHVDSPICLTKSDDYDEVVQGTPVELSTFCFTCGACANEMS